MSLSDPPATLPRGTTLSGGDSFAESAQYTQSFAQCPNVNRCPISQDLAASLARTDSEDVVDQREARQRFGTVTDGLAIDLHAHPAVNLALVHNGVPLVMGLEIRNDSDADIVDVQATVELLGGSRHLAPSHSEVLDGALAPGRIAFWDNYAALVPEIPHLRELNESYPATISVTVSRLWGDDIHLNAPIRVLAHNEWFNAPVFFDSLAAFVQPNTRAVGSVLDAASEILGAHTGETALNGYQKGPERAALIAAAIYEALRRRQIRYSNPPASFEGTGQKIRTTAQVLDERFGTCIDLSVTYAACLEQAGLRPLIWLTTGHALAGYMREETNLAHTTITEKNVMINLVESGQAVPIEAAFYDLASTGSFKSAVAQGRKHFSNPDSLNGVVAIGSARKDGIRPLPTLDDLAKTEVTAPPISSNADLDLPPELRGPTNSFEAVFDTTDTAPARVQKWKRSLLDLSTRNRLLNLKASREVIDLHVPTSGLALLDDLVHDDVKIELVPHDTINSIHELQGARRAQDIDDKTVIEYLRDRGRIYAAVPAESYQARLKHLQRTARTMLEETGNANLYLTFGGLMHTTSTGKLARAPLFLLPVKVVGGTGRSSFHIVIDTSGVSTPNYCLVEWLRLKHNVTIDALESPPLDGSGIDIDAALQGVRAAMVTHNLDLRVDETAALAICQFGTFGMWKDLEDHWDILEKSPVVRHLTHTPGESFRDVRRPDGTDIESITVDELDVPVPIPADGSQLRAVALAADGHTFVLEGPPGTGKSQTITNLIANTLAQGKSVLFVAEKQAALDVVKKRLAKVGLSDFTLDLHGKNQSANVIRAQLKKAIDNSPHYNQRAWAARLAELRSKHLPLDDYPNKIHQTNGVDHSLWSAHDTLLSLDDGPVAPVPRTFVSAPPVAVPVITTALQQFERAARSVTINRHNPWSLAGHSDAETPDSTFVDASHRLSTALATARRLPAVVSVLERVPTPEAIDLLLPQARRQVGQSADASSAARQLHGPHWIAERQALLNDLAVLQQQCGPITAVFLPSFIEAGSVDTLLPAAEEATKGLFGKKKRTEEFIRNSASVLLPGVQLDPESAIPLLRSIPSTRELAGRIVSRMHGLLGPLAPPVWNPLTTDAAQRLQPGFDQIEATSHFAGSQPQLWQILTEVGPLQQSDIDGLVDVAHSWQEWRRLLGTTNSDFDHWCSQSHWFTAWLRDSDAWAADIAAAGATPLRQWSAMTSFLSPLRAAGLHEFVDELLTGAIGAGDAEIAFMRGVAVCSLDERRRVHALLGFDQALKDGEIVDYAKASDNLRQEQVAALPAQLLDRRPFQANALTGEVGQLRRQLDTKRGGTTFRQLMNRYAEQILAATPCFFVSPTSLAQFIPPGSATFDVVVFDEASQVTVPQAIGALGRGRSAVIVGDSQQMPPTAIGQVNTTTGDDGNDTTGEEEEVVPDDLESILTEAVESQIPRLWLSWHYRSQDESLISFSNKKYYEGRLASLPSPGLDSTAGVEWRRVDGHFNREDTKVLHRTNVVEAEAIVAEIRRRLSNAHLAGQSIGVVTFNTQQQTLVLDLLEKSGDPLVIDQLRADKEDGIFVKNLENVQGDERDVILFTTAFSKRPNDPKMPLNFGPLTRTGGEKRLNVAVTRARRKVIVFTSFEPSDIDLSRTNSVGMAHLRGYLEAAANTADMAGQGGHAPLDQIQASLCSALQARGFEVATNYGLSEFVLDIVVREDSSTPWLVAVMLDGPLWARRPTVADRDLTPQLLETKMHWGAFVRVWLPELITNPDAVIQRISEAITRSKAQMAARQAAIDEAAEAQALAIAAVERAEETVTELVIPPAFAADHVRWLKPEDLVPPVDPPLQEAAAPLRNAAVTLDAPISDTSTSDRRGHKTAYVEAPVTTLGPRTDLDRINSPSVRATITNAVRETVDIEGPISTDRLARSIGRRFDLSRVAAGKREIIVRCVPPELIRSSELGEFVWPREIDPAAWRDFRPTPTGLTRPLNDIAPEEIINAMMSVCTKKVDDQTLRRQTLAVFDQKRLTGPANDRLNACIALGVQRGQLIQVGDYYRSGS